MGRNLLNCQSRWSLYLWLALCLDHLIIQSQLIPTERRVQQRTRRDPVIWLIALSAVNPKMEWHILFSLENQSYCCNIEVHNSEQQGHWISDFYLGLRLCLRWWCWCWLSRPLGPLYSYHFALFKILLVVHEDRHLVLFWNWNFHFFCEQGGDKFRQRLGLWFQTPAIDTKRPLAVRYNALRGTVWKSMYCLAQCGHPEPDV